MPPSLRLARLPRMLVPVLAGALLLMACGESSDDSESVPYTIGSALSDSTLALVVSSDYGTDTLSAQQYDRQAKRRLGRMPPQQQTPDTLRSIHRELVRSVAAQHVVQGEAQAQNIQVDTARVSKRLAQIRQRYQSESQFRKQLAQSNMTIDSLRSYIASQMKAQEMQRQMAESAESPTESEVGEYSQENRRIRAQHILLQVGEDAPQTKIDSARQAAEALIDSADAGTDFSALARRHSEGSTAEEGGDLGYFTRDQMVDSFSKAAFALADSGDVAPEPVRTRFGFHVIRLTDAGQPMDTTKARKQMTRERRQAAFDRELDDLLSKATVRANPDVVEAGFYE